MRAINTKALIILAHKQSYPLSKAIAEATECDIVVPSILRSKFEALGMKIVRSPGKFVVRIDVIDVSGTKPQLIASGTSGDDSDALLHAALGYVRERYQDELVAAGMTRELARAQSGKQPTDEQWAAFQKAR